MYDNCVPAKLGEQSAAERCIDYMVHVIEDQSNRPGRKRPDAMAEQ